MPAVINYQYYNSPCGELIIGSFNGKLCLCDWRYRKMRSKIDERICQGLQAEMKEVGSSIIDETIDQLNCYFNNGLHHFKIPLLPVGTDFQKSVWNQLVKIPYGETRSYKQLAKCMNNPLGIRAIASANKSNAISIIIPCHRIIGSKGALVGYAGGLKAKKSLLLLEGAIHINQLKLL